jgi:type IV pilus assembly protein PilP
MKKIKFTSFNAFIIVLIAAFFSFAAETKNVPQSASSAKVTTDATKATVQSQAKPAPAAVSTPTKPAPVAAATEVKKAAVQGQAKPAPADASTPTKPAPVATTANVTPDSKSSPVAPSAPVSALSVPSPVASYNYNPTGKPDPFKSFIAEPVDKKKTQTKTAEAQKEKPLSIFPLQRAEADKYKVVGIVGNEDQRIAVAEDAAKKHYPLLIGTRIGLHNGKVVEILADRVIVEEYENNKEKRVILKLRKN